MDSIQGHAAAWAAPLFSHIHTADAATCKHTHKLAPMPCVLWLPDYRAYVRSIDLMTASFTTCPNAEGAMRLGDEQAQFVGQDLIEVTGVRLHVRAFHPAHSARGAYVNN